MGLERLQTQGLRPEIESIFQTESRKVFSTLVRALGDFDLAEDAMHEAFRAAIEQWPTEGVPKNPAAWLVSTARFKAIDTIRRSARLSALYEDSARFEPEPPEVIVDETLRLIFTCCHPALSEESQVALTLREVCQLTTEEIAQAYLLPPATLAQRIVRAKSKIRVAKIPFELPTETELPGRLRSVLRVIYLVYNEGYSAVTERVDLVAESIRLAKSLRDLLPEPEVLGLLGLMMLHESRRGARIGEAGDLISLEQQDRSQWDSSLIEEGVELTLSALRSGRGGFYSLQAAISAVHSESPSWIETDRVQIIGLYQVMNELEPSPIIELNCAVAISMVEGSEIALNLVDDLLSKSDLSGYHLVHAVRGDLLAKLGRTEEASQEYKKAIDRSDQPSEQRFLQRKLDSLVETS